MLTERRLSLEEGMKAIEVVVAEASRDARPMAIAVVDKQGELICCLRMDRAAPRILRHAIRKAYTAAVMERDTTAFKQDLQERDGNLDEWGDVRLTTLQGGVAIKVDGECVGAIGVGGNTRQRDKEIAQLVAAGMGL
jgi:uncharacterized protein GlcG (DUF336 family)